MTETLEQEPQKENPKFYGYYPVCKENRNFIETAWEDYILCVECECKKKKEVKNGRNNFTN